MFSYSNELEIQDIIQTLQTPRTVATLEPFKELMLRIGSPHLKLPKIIHVAGTNGKGSTLAYLDEILQSNSNKVHRYTSPHLISICERIQIANQTIDQEKLKKTLEWLSPYTKDLQLTFFEIITAVAFNLFSQHPADYLLLETGLGGRYDATNIIENPIACLITQIGLDHMDRLGDTIELIAKEKAGIIKTNSPVFSLEQDERVRIILEKESKMLNAQIFFTEPQQELQTQLRGKHQQQNAALAFQIATQLNLAPEAIILQGLKQTKWPARMQEHIAYGRKIWIDMAHNPSAAQTSIETLMEVKNYPFHMVFALRSTKDLDSFIKAFKPHLLSATYVSISEGNIFHDKTVVEQLSKKSGITINYSDSLTHALKKLDGSPILITGSSMLVGQALQLK